MDIRMSKPHAVRAVDRGRRDFVGSDADFRWNGAGKVSIRHAQPRRTYRCSPA
jgi:hypothetical protein